MKLTIQNAPRAAVSIKKENLIRLRSGRMNKTNLYKIYTNDDQIFKFTRIINFFFSYQNISKNQKDLEI